MSELYNASDAEREWMEIAHQNNVVKSNGVTGSNASFAHGRKFSRRFNTSLVSNATKRRFARLECWIIAV